MITEISVDSEPILNMTRYCANGLMYFFFLNISIQESEATHPWLGLTDGGHASFARTKNKKLIQNGQWRIQILLTHEPFQYSNISFNMVQYLKEIWHFTYIFKNVSVEEWEATPPLLWMTGADAMPPLFYLFKSCIIVIHGKLSQMDTYLL